MNNKGFTLIELLGVIVLLSVLGIIAVSTIDKNIKEGRVKTCKAQERNIIEGAKTYSLDNPNYTGKVSVKELMTDGYIRNDLVNPMTDKVYTDSTFISISYNSSNNKYSYSINYVDEKGCD